MKDQDITSELQAHVKTAIATQTPLQIIGGNTKAFYGYPITPTPLHIQNHQGILNYDPTELVITARSGTPLRDIETTLAAQQQILPFEPPHFGNTATLGGTIASGLAGSSRPYRGAVRDAVLGIRLLNGHAEVLRFGGEVMKNVAGYDVSRLMVGALGTLGILLDISVKVLPRPPTEITLIQHLNMADALTAFNRWANQPLPITACAWWQETAYIRLSGTLAGVNSAKNLIGGELLADAEIFWTAIREQQHPYFQSAQPLWRLSLPPATPPLTLQGEQLIDWGGAQRWLITNAPTETIRTLVAQAGGHATLFRHAPPQTDIFHPLPPPLLQLHQRLKHAFDPHHLFNPQRLHPTF